MWGIALLVCGLLMAIAVSTYGVRKFREEQLNHKYSNIKVGRWWDIAIGIVVPLESVFLVAWWFYQARNENPDTWLRPFSSYNVGTALFQWGIALVVLLLLNKKMALLYLSHRESKRAE